VEVAGTTAWVHAAAGLLSGVNVIEPIGTLAVAAPVLVDDGKVSVAMKDVAVPSSGLGGVAVRVKTVLPTVTVSMMLGAWKLGSLP
jgi:hypothetical protein